MLPRGGGDVEVVLGQAADGAVVQDDAVLTAEDAVADSTRLQVGEVVGVDQVQQLARVAALDLQFPQGAHVDDSDPLPDRPPFLLRFPVAEGAHPLPHGHLFGAGGLVPLVKRRQLDRVVVGTRQDPEGNGSHRGPGRGSTGLVQRAAGLPGTGAGQQHLAHLALTRAHGGGGVALEELHLAEPFLDRVGHVLVRHVLAEADEGLFASRALAEEWDLLPGLPGPSLLPPLPVHPVELIQSLGRLPFQRTDGRSGPQPGGSALAETGGQILDALQVARRLDVLRKGLADVLVADGVEAGLAPFLPWELDGRRPGGAEAHQVADVGGQPLPVRSPVSRAGAHSQRLDSPASLGSDGVRRAEMGHAQIIQAAGGAAPGRIGAPVHHHRQLDARVVELQRQLQTFVVRDHHGGPCPGPNPVQVQELPHPGTEHHARQVVSSEHQGIFMIARRRYQLVVPEMDEPVPPGDAQEPALVGAEGQRPGQNLDSGMVQDLPAPAKGQLETGNGSAGVRIDDRTGLGPESATQVGFAFHQDHLGAGFGRRQGGRHSGGSCSHDGDFGMEVLVLVMRRLGRSSA